MSQSVSPELIEAALTGVVEYGLLVRVGSASSLTPPALLNALGLHVAQKYAAGEMSFEEADTIMNAAFGAAVSEEFWAKHDRTIPESMYEVYLAFDAGEYCRPSDGEGIDPELKYTKPAIASFLASQENGA
jgi:hypothetical protein